MHKSQLAGLVIDCRTDDLGEAAAFWAAALGLEAVADPRSDTARYRRLRTRPGEPDIEVQKVSHDSRVHLDIETDDKEAEVARLERLGARRIADTTGWVIMEAPSGQRFCVVNAFTDHFDRSANIWD
jgi:hypothetical protein